MDVPRDWAVREHLQSKLRAIRATDEFEALLLPPTSTPAEVSLADQPAEAPVVAHIRAFDSLYEEAEEYTLATYGGRRKRNRPAAIRQALIRGMKEAGNRYSANFKLLHR